MTVMQSCDWHDEGRAIPDHLSRKTVSGQLRASLELAQAVEHLSQGGMNIDAQSQTFYAVDGHIEQGHVTLSLPRYMALLEALRQWTTKAPRHAESYEKPSGPPAEIRVPPDDVTAPGGADRPPLAQPEEMA